MSSADRVRLSYIKEVTLGTTPSPSPAMKVQRMLNESLNYNVDNVVSQELRSDRNQVDPVQIGMNVGGGVNYEFSWGTYDDFIESAFGAAFVVQPNPKIKILNPGTVIKGFTIQKEFLDLSGIQHIFKGCVVNNWTMAMTKKAAITGAFDFMGMNFTDTALTTPTYAAASTTDVMNTSSHLTSVLLDDTPFTSCVDSLSFSTKNNLRAQECLGSLGPQGFTMGRFEITGDIELYFKDATLYSKYKSGATFDLTFEQTDVDGNKMKYEFQRCFFEKMSVLAGGTNQDVMAKGSWRALLDPVSGSMGTITSTSI